MSSFQLSSVSPSVADYTIVQSLLEKPEFPDISSDLSASWKRFKGSSSHPSSFVVDADVIPATNAATALADVLIEESMSPEDREERAKTLQLAARIEHLYRTDEGFRRWYHKGIEEIESGHFEIFGEEGQEEE